MKKYLIIFCICLCSVCAHAQLGLWRSLLNRATTKLPRITTRGIEQSIRQQAAILPQEMFLKIHNLPDQPLVKLGTPLPSLNGQDKTLSVLPARIMSGTESYKILFPEQRISSPLYVPTALNTAEEVAYRGVTLYDLKSIQNLLENGLEYNRVSPAMDNKIYFSGEVYRAARFAAHHNSPYGELPVLIKFALPEYRDNIYAHDYLYSLDYYFFVQDLSADYLLDVMVFLEVNGVPGWYKATLEKGNLVFTPVPSRLFEEKELIKHDIKIPQQNVQDDW